MADRVPNIPQVKPIYEAPRAVRLDDSNRGQGDCFSGSTDGGNCQPGTTAGIQCFPGTTADGDCYQNGGFAGGGCTSPGNTLGG